MCEFLGYGEGGIRTLGPAGDSNFETVPEPDDKPARKAKLHF